ncbi:uncharacterized protein LOC144357942 [Saccoglossus kowalevskii]
MLTTLSEVSYGALLGPYKTNPFNIKLVYSPLSTVPKNNTQVRRVIMDLSFPTNTSGNDGIPNDLYLEEPFKPRYPSIDNLVNLINSSGHDCMLFKCDIRWIPVDPRDFHLLGITWRDHIFIDTKLPFGLRSSAMACQRCTNALMYVYHQAGYDAVNYIDDFAGAATSEIAENAYELLTNTINKYCFCLCLADKQCVPLQNCSKTLDVG